MAPLEAQARPEPSQRILVIEDERSIASAVAARLRSEGYTVEIAADGPSGLEACARVQPDLVVLDLMLPGIDGIEVCKRIQQDRAVPVLMLTARDSESDLVAGLDVGADDYMTKPFSARELVARVQAILRRAAPTVDASDSGPARIGDVELDPATRRVTASGEPVHLTPTEFDLLMYLAARPGRVSTREELLERVWGYEVPSGARTVDSHVRSLRRKLGADLIRTVHGVGYAVEETTAERPEGSGARSRPMDEETTAERPEETQTEPTEGEAAPKSTSEGESGARSRLINGGATA